MNWQTIWDYFVHKSHEYSQETALIYKSENKWQYLSYQQYYYKVLSLATGFHHIGFEAGNKVALYAPNCPEWNYSYLAGTANGAIMVPIDNKMCLAEFTHIMNSSKTRYLILHQDDLDDQLHETISNLKHLEHTVVIGDNIEKIEKYGLEKGEIICEKKCSLQRFRKTRKHPSNYYTSLNDLYFTHEINFNPSDYHNKNEIASIIYTSGTTGIPKGVMLTHNNFLTNMSQIDEFLSQHLELGPSDRFLLVLPLNHAYAFTANFLLPILRGMSVIFVESLTRVSQNALELSPTILIAVPLLLEKMYKRIHGQLQESILKKNLFRFSWFKKIVGKKFKEKMGAKLRIIISGGAPLDPQICSDFWDMNLTLLQGYGMTEASPVITVNPPLKTKYASVGIPLPGNEVKVVDVNKEGIGELMVKGGNVMKGYYEMPEETQKVLKNDWLYTGDLGYIDEDNYVFIKGRKKNIIVNREGKNIYPEEIEIVLNESPFIQETLVLGYQEQEVPGEKVGAIIVPNLEYFEDWSYKRKVTLNDTIVEKIIRNEVKRYCQNISSYKHPRKIKIQTEPFQKTPTQKIKRTLYEF